MHIDWSALGLVFAASLGAVITVVVLFGLGVLGMSQYATARAQGDSGSSSAAAAGVAFFACAVVALYGVYLIIAK